MSTTSVTKLLRVAAAKNGHAFACEVDATKFLLALPRGAYTAARTVRQTHLFDYEGHLKRLADSVNSMHAATQTVTSLPVVTMAQVDAALRPTLCAGMEQFHDLHGKEPTEEYKVTVLICTNESNVNGHEKLQAAALGAATDIYCHVAVLPQLRDGLCKLQIAGLPRTNAAAKDSAWVRDRKAIYDALPADVEEIVLMDPSTHELLEGSQTNFYAIQDGRVFTANDGILEGTVRRLVLEVCRDLGIELVLDAPKLETIEQWEACFISSTSRLVLGAASLEYPVEHDAANGTTDMNIKKVKTFEKTNVLERIITGVRAAFENKSTQVF